MGFVYILGAEGTNRIKIGRTKASIEKRVAQLQTGNPFVIVERDRIETLFAPKVESYLHALLATYRGQSGEWFEVPPGILAESLDQAVEYASHLDEHSSRIQEFAGADVEERDEPADEDDRRMHLELLGLYAESRRIAAEIEKRENTLKLRIKNAEALGNIASWKVVHSTRLDQDRLKREHPELAVEFSVQSASRRFMVNRNIEDE